jgi:predicted DNA-binding transcriptional regulator AlpA
MHHLVGMAEIAEMLGVSRQRVGQLIETYDDFPKPEVEISGGRVWSRTAVETWIATHPERGAGRPKEDKPRRKLFGRQYGSLFSRFTDRARQAIVLAQEEARLMNHNYIGTEHLLLGLIHLADGIAFSALDSLGVTLEAVRSQIDEMIGPGPSTPEGHIPFTPRTQKVLEIALREALQMGHNFVGTEHVLLGLVREGEGVGWQALERLGLKKKATRETVLNILTGMCPVPTKGVGAFPEPALVPVGEYVLCTFCGKPVTEVATMIAGPGVYICDKCVGLAVDIVAEHGKAIEHAASVDVEVTDRLAVLERTVAELTQRLTDELRKRDE